MELHYHGSYHRDRDEWMHKFDESQVVLENSDLFFRGFKAPWYMMEQRAADYFNEKGFLVSARQGRYDVCLQRSYRFNEGREVFGDICYENGVYRSVNSHVQPMKQKLGLPDIFDSIVALTKGNYRFLYVSELPCARSI